MNVYIYFNILPQHMKVGKVHAFNYFALPVRWYYYNLKII